MVTYKPVAASFIGVYVAVAVLLAVASGIVLSLFVTPLIGIVAAAVIVVAALIRRFKQYDKEVYAFSEEGIRVNRGSRFSNVEITVPWQNVTSIQYRRPFFERILFGTGTCMVDSAGSASSSVSLRHVPEDVLDDVIHRFSFQSSPRGAVDANTVAAVGRGAWQALSSLVGAALVFVFPQQGLASGVVLGFLALSLLGSALVALRQIIDDVTLTYTAYDDHVSIHGGYFNIRSGYLRAEHITDISASQELLDRFLDVEAVTVSVAGGERDIKLPYVPREASFEALIPRRERKAVESDSQNKSVIVDDTDEASDNTGEAVETSPHLWRNAAGLFIVLLVASPVLATYPFLVLLAVFYGAQRFFRPVFTTYSADETTIESEFSFLSRSTTRFEKDRVTGVTVARNPLDYVFGTVSVFVQSVGSSGRLVFSHVREGHRLVDELTGLKHVKDTQHTVRPSLRPAVYLSRYLPGLLLVLGVIGGLLGRGSVDWAVGIGAGIVCIAAIRFWRLRFASLRFGSDHLALRTGWLFQRRRTAAYGDVKRVRSCLYPLSDAGSVEIFVPGGSQVSLLSLRRGWELPCAVEPWQQHGVVDGCVFQESWSAPLDVDEIRWEDTPYVPALMTRNVVLAALSGAVLFGLVSYDVVSVPVGIGVGAVIIGVAAWSALYHSQSVFSDSANRRIAERGILYRCATTVLDDKVDYTDVRRAWYDLLFDTGSVSVYTTGSMESDLVFNSIRTYDTVWEE